MRPHGLIREAVLATLRTHGAMPLCELATKSQVSRLPCRWTLKNLVRHGVLQIVGHEKRPHAKRWVALYDIAPSLSCPDAAEAASAIGDAMSTWR